MSRLYLVLFIAGTLVFSACSASNPTPTKTMKMQMPDFVQQAGPLVQEAYQFAVSNPEALMTVPCYCGCNSLGHKNNLDCYIKSTAKDDTVTYDNHAAYCGICINITEDVIRLSKEGKSPHEIRSYIDTQYTGYGPSTDTVKPEG